MSEETEVRAAFSAFRDALMDQDSAALDALLTEDYRGYNLLGGLEDRSVVIEAYRPGNAQLDSLEVEDSRIEVFQEVGVYSGIGRITGTWRGDPWSHHLRFVDFWVKRGGAWKLHLSCATPMGGSEGEGPEG